MATFQVRIEDLIGTVGDTAAESDWLTEGARIVADRMRPERLVLYATDKSDSGSGVTITGGKALSAHKTGYEATLIPIGLKAKTLDGDSLHYAIATDPSWYMDASKGYVVPGGGTIKWFGYPTVAFGSFTISDYPSEALGAVVYYAAIQGLFRKTSDLVGTTMAGISFSVVATLPTIIDNADSNFVYTKPSFGGSFTNITTALTNHDVELAQGEGVKLNVYLQQYGTDLQNELNKFQAAYQIYHTSLDEWRLEIDKYSAEVQKEVARIQSIIGQYGQMSQVYLNLLGSLEKEYNRIVETL